MLTRVISLLALLGGLAAAQSKAETSPSLPSSYQAFRQPGVSMEPTIGVGDVVLADTAYFIKSPPKVGDIVLYRAKSIQNGPTVKRIIALGGSRIQLKGGKLIVDGHSLDEPYVKQGGAVTLYSQEWGPLALPEGCIILLGDHRDHSQDSRADGCSSIRDLVGLVRYVAPSADPGNVREVR